MTSYPPLGRRIVVFGQSGSGKTTLARELGHLLRLPVVELDAMFHQPGWTPTPGDQFRSALDARLSGHPDGWIVDGNYGEVRDSVLAQAETVVWLRLPFRTVYPRLVRRTLGRMWTGEELWNGNRESFRMGFLSRESILLWGITNWRPHVAKMERSLRSPGHSARVLVLRSAAEVQAFRREARLADALRSIPAPATSPQD